MRTAILGLGLLLASGCATLGVEEPAYSVIRADADFEIRDYPPTIVAEIIVTGGAENSRNAAFQPLADYIFARDRKGGKIAMTAPVTQSARAKIAMTAPVTQERSTEGWTISFTMPAGYTMDTLPQPENPAVRLVELPTRRMAVLSYSGFVGDELMDAKRVDLMAGMAMKGLLPVGEPVFAFYDPPWTLPFLRRNEVMIEVAGMDDGAQAAITRW